MRFVTILKTAFLYIFFLGASPSLFAQLTNLQFKHLTPNEGLTQGVIEYIFTDSRGFVWMTGLDGINRFDGTKCLANYQIAPGLMGISRTHGSMEDNNGDVWFGYTEGLIKYSYRLNLFEIIPFKKNMPSRLINRGSFYIPVAADTNNAIVVSINANQVFVYHPVSKKITELPVVIEKTDRLCGLFLKVKNRGFGNNLYLARQQNEMFYLYKYGVDNNNSAVWNLVVSRARFSKSVISVAVQDDSTLIICAESQIARYHFNTGNFEIKKFLKISSQYLAVDINKNIWVGTIKEGLYAIDGKTLEIKAQYQNEPTNPGSIAINKVIPFCDRLGNLWLCAINKGVDYCNLVDTKFMSSFTEQQSLSAGSGSFIRDIIEDADGNFYGSANGHGIVMLDKNLRFVKNLPGINTQLICPDMQLQDQSLYIGSDIFSEPFLFKYNLSTHHVKKIINKHTRYPASTNVYQLSAMTNGHLLAGTYGGLWKLNTTTDAFESLPGITDISETVVFSYQDRQGQLYKGINDGGLIVYRPTVSEYKKVFGIEKTITVKHGTEINDSMMWIGTSDGLYLFNPKTLNIIKHYTTANGLANNVVYAIMPDEQNNLWLSTNKGLSYFNTTAGYFKHFTREDGLQSSEFNTHTVVRAKDGRIIFGGVKGLTTINPAMLYKKSISPIVQLTALKADSSMNPFTFNEKNILHLPAGSNFIEFEITAIDFINPAKCSVQYRLKGFADEWIEASNPGIAQFIKLPYGNYTLEYRASNAEGDWTAPASKIFAFTIAAFWWQTWWFYSLIGLTIAAILYGIYRNRFNQLKRVFEVRNKISRDLHDDIGATLSGIAMYSHLTREQIRTNQPEQVARSLDVIQESATGMVDKLNDIVWVVNPRHDSLQKLMQKLEEYATEMAAVKKIKVHADLPEKINNLKLPMQSRRSIYLVCKEAINNAVKYSDCSLLQLQVQVTNNTVEFCIKDNGRGFSESGVKKGNGLNNMKQRAGEIGAVLQISSGPGEGTTISLQCRIPH